MINSFKGAIFRTNYHSRRKFFFLIIIYSMVIPLGTSIGWAFSSIFDDGITTAVFQSITAGTLLFLVVVKSPVEEFLVSRMKIVKGIGFFLGVFTVVIFHCNEFSGN